MEYESLQQKVTNSLKREKGCYNADDVKALFMKKFSDGRPISRGILTFTERTSAKQNAASDRMNSPLHGLYYLFAKESLRQAIMVRVRCGKCKIQELNDIDATYETSTGNHIVRTFMCRTCPKSKNGRSLNKYHFPIDNYTSTATWESLRAAYKAAIGMSLREGKAMNSKPKKPKKWVNFRGEDQNDDPEEMQEEDARRGCEKRIRRCSSFASQICFI